jgi:SAM-dependent methyltransferase
MDTLDAATLAPSTTPDGVTDCPVCGKRHLTSFLKQSNVPAHQNRVITTQQAARSVTRGQIDMVVCEDCGFVFNRLFDMALMTYDQEYDSNRACSAQCVDYMDGMVSDLIEARGVRDCDIVEIGCGPGQFIRRLICYPNSGNRGTGFDPSYSGPDSELDGRLQFRRCYYDESCVDVPADVVISRHMIEHVADPVALLRLLRDVLAKSPDARVFFETPCIEWILRNRVMGDIYYEHCSMFSAASFSLAFERAGFDVLKVEHIFDGQYLWLEGRLAKGDAIVHDHPHGTVALASTYGADEQAQRGHWLALLNDLRTEGKVALWGAGAKGTTFANIVDPDGVLIECAVDMNPNRQGNYIPGTGHLVVQPDRLPQLGVTSAILTNPIYRDEIQRHLDSAGIHVKLIDWKHW